jgi:uncharacterized protein (UPF0335 family)
LGDAYDRYIQNNKEASEKDFLAARQAKALQKVKDSEEIETLKQQIDDLFLNEDERQFDSGAMEKIIVFLKREKTFKEMSEVLNHLCKSLPDYLLKKLSHVATMLYNNYKNFSKDNSKTEADFIAARGYGAS